ncbi:mitochondrial 54S ribosomal protein YmL15 [Saccharomycopsis crataegensis]|uniref:Mitochondrial 54S ribosomal protein YmL15 n=1 Tax=Saccharomycopsis crataegensis TaxID=43959 RepID=A0AAV5QV09_9ASCO|nr:mitochondrial 54S ribosomal protein YmL15 [Saccharomycopsis crataegensis]
MNSIRLLGVRSFNGSTTQIIPRRTLVNTGSRVRGMLRDPADYLVSSSGRRYPENATGMAPIISNLKNYLSQNSVEGIDDKVLLQVLTHKSFAHGKKPFNEKLSVFGVHLLKEISAIHLIESEASEGASVEGLNVDVLGGTLSKRLLHKSVLAQFTRLNIPGIEKDIFWRNRNLMITDPAVNGENVVLFDTILATVGAVNLIKGKGVASDFIGKAILSGENSLVELAKATISKPQENKSE